MQTSGSDWMSEENEEYCGDNLEDDQDFECDTCGGVFDRSDGEMKGNL